MKELVKKQSYITYKKGKEACEGNDGCVHSYLDKKWMKNIRNINNFIDCNMNRPKSVPPLVNAEHSDKLKQRKIKSTFSGLQVNKCPCIISNNRKLHHNYLTIGQKRYLWDTARCYSIQNLKILNNNRIKCLLDYEFMKRYISAGVPCDTKVMLWKEYCDYRIQIDKSSCNHHASCLSCRSSSPRSRSRISKLSNSVDRADTDKLKLIDDTMSSEKENTDICIRARPKSAKYQKRLIRKSSSQSLSSLEDELVFFVEEKLSLFEKVLADYD